MTATTADKTGRRRLGLLACSTITLLFLGLIYAFSMFAAPMSQTFGLPASEVSLTFNIMMIAFCLSAVAGSQMERRLGTRVTLAIAAVAFLVAFVGTGLLGGVGIGVLYGFYGVLGGSAVGVAYNVILSATNAWFPDRVGFSSGIQLMGFGLGSLTLGTLASSLVPALGLPAVFVGIAALTCLAVVALSLVLRRPSPEESALLAPAAAAATAGDDPADDESPLRTPSFYVYWVWEAIVLAIGLATIGNCASDAQLAGIDAATATLLVGIVSTCNGLSRVVVGAIFDRTGTTFTLVVDNLAALCSALCIMGALVWQVPALYVAGALCCGFCYGGVPVVATAFTRQRFGARNYPLNLSLSNLAIVYGSLVNIALQTTVGQGSRLSVFAVLTVMALVGLGTVAVFSRMLKGDMARLDALRQAARRR